MKSEPQISSGRSNHWRELLSAISSYRSGISVSAVSDLEVVESAFVGNFQHELVSEVESQMMTGRSCNTNTESSFYILSSIINVLSTVVAVTRKRARHRLRVGRRATRTYTGCSAPGLSVVPSRRRVVGRCDPFVSPLRPPPGGFRRGETDVPTRHGIRRPRGKNLLSNRQLVGTPAGS